MRQIDIFILTTVFGALSVLGLMGAYFLGEAHVAFLVQAVRTALLPITFK